VTDPCGFLAPALDRLRGAYRCHATADPRTMTVTTSRHYTDGDAVEVFLRISADGTRFAVSDGGLSHARRDLYASPELKGTALTLWREVLEDHGLSEFKGRIYTTGDVEAADVLITQIADAALVLDSVRLLAVGERKTFSSKLHAWLDKLDGISVKPESSVVDIYGSEQHISAIVESPVGDVLVQGAGGKNVSELRKNAEHAHWTFSFLREEDWPVEKRLVVLETSLVSTEKQRIATASLVQRLTSRSYVAAFDSPSTVKRFLADGPSYDKDMVTLAYQQAELRY